MSKRSTAFRLNTLISITIAAILVAVILIVLKYSQGLIHDNVEKNAINLSTQTISEIREKIISSENAAKNLASQLPYYIENGNVSRLLNTALSDYPFLQAVHIDLKEGAFPGKLIEFSAYHLVDSIIYVETDEPYFVNEVELDVAKPIMSIGEEGWTEPFICKESGEAVSMYCLPVFADNNERRNNPDGYISLELSLSFLNNEIKNIKIGESGFSFLISKEGTYLTHPNEEWMLAGNIKNLSEIVDKDDRQVIKELPGKSTSGSFIAYPKLLDYKKSWVYYTPIPENNWMLIFVVPYSELNSELMKLLYKLLAISFSGLGLIIILTTYISKKLINPIAQIASEIHEFSTAGKTKKSENEVEILEKSFALIREWYNKFIKEREESNRSIKLIKNELEQASEIINNIIPSEVPMIPGLDELNISSVFRPANVIGGDFYDYFMIDDNHLLITIGDVSGKGISAAFFMGVAHTLLRSNASTMIPNYIVKELNNGLFLKNPNQYFLTLFVAILDLKSGILSYCNAAHTTSLILRANGEIEELSGSHGLPLGLYTNKDYKSSLVKLLKDDILILYTDGVTDTINKDGKRFGEKNFKKIIFDMKNQTPSAIADNIEKELKKFRNGEKQSDDFSIVVIKNETS